jgi:hypothetical protein
VILVNVQPTESTVVRVDQNPEFPPSLVITDGHATVWFAPRDSPEGPILAAEFAGRLLQCGQRWYDACRALASHGLQEQPRRQVAWVPQSPDPSGGR